MSRYRDDRSYGSDHSSGTDSRSREEQYGVEPSDHGARDRHYDDSSARGLDTSDRRDYGYDRGGRYTAHDRSRYGDHSDYGEERGHDRLRYKSRGAAIRCRDIMTRDMTVATPSMSLQDIAIMMRDEDTGIIPVVEHLDLNDTDETGGYGRPTNKGKLVGLITDRDIVIRAVAKGKRALDTRAEEIMSEALHTAKPNDRIEDVIRKMGDEQVRRIPVVDDNYNLRGIISMADVALETEKNHELAEALEILSTSASRARAVGSFRDSDPESLRQLPESPFIPTSSTGSTMAASTGDKPTVIIKLDEPIKEIAKSVGDLVIEQVKSLLVGPQLQNYSGFVCVLIATIDGEPLTLNDDGVFLAAAGQECRLEVWLQPDRPPLGSAVPVNIQDGQDADKVDFEIILDSDTLNFVSQNQTITVQPGTSSQHGIFNFSPPTAPGKYEVWAQIFQKNRLIQVIQTGMLVK